MTVQAQAQAQAQPQASNSSDASTNDNAVPTPDSETKPDAPKPDPPKPGMIADVKNLYESKPDNRGKTTWVDKYPDDIEAAAENAESARFALLIRNKKCYDGRKALQIDSIIIQSPLLKKSLGKILKDYPGVTTTLERLTFKAPFQPFVHRWRNLVEELEQESDEEAKGHLKLLHSILGSELENDLKAREDYILNGVITYDTAWMIFEPGTIIYNREDNQDRAARFTSGSYVQLRCGNAYRLNCQIVDWDGESFGLGSWDKHIMQWEGTEKITELSAYPLEYHPELEKTKQELIKRGRAFENLSGYHFKHYQGAATGEGPWGPIKYNVDSRIIVDTYAWNRFNPNDQVSLNNLGDWTKARYNGSDSDGDYDDDYYEGSEYDSDDGTLANARKSSGNTDSVSALSKEQLLTCSSSLKGYSLKNKKWLTFSIDAIKDIKYNDRAFESLVLPSDHKELILALAESQVLNKETFDDVVQGKGKGMIMLLSGPPGVGKTLTAEAVAEVMRAPLYMMSAGDLGFDPSKVENNLSNVLEMATKWNAILLLDEADVFLEQRSSHDLERNKLVSIFLRILEYYEGILFLTTNRVDNIDAAFQSRIHVSMEYNELSAASRKHVWRNFLAASTKGSWKHTFSEEDIDQLSEYRMNGREIKNVLKTAQLLASKKGVGLGAEHVRSILAIERRHVIVEDKSLYDD